MLVVASTPRRSPMSDRPISRFPVADVTTLPAELRDAVTATAERAGFMPNVFRAYAWKPEHLRAFLGYHDALMKGESGLSRAERELIALAVSAANRCLY
jgi:uncharacterized peroxidase-related enzyme